MTEEKKNSIDYHPTYIKDSLYWVTWRELMDGGDYYIDRNLEQFSAKEDATEFAARKKMTYNPAYAMTDLIEVKNAAAANLSKVTRLGGDKSYQEAMDGLNGGVDYAGNTMTAFLSSEVLLELLGMKRVGIFIDMASFTPATRASKQPHPYLYVYKTEDIVNWSYGDPLEPYKLTAVLLRTNSYKFDNIGFPVDTAESYRQLILVPEGVKQIIYDSDKVEQSSVTVPIPMIPFVILEINQSLLKDVVRHNVALLNMESGDVAFAMKQNFPIYTEQYHPISDAVGVKGNGSALRVGASYGKRYPVGSERPNFINPSPDPLTVNIEKEKNIRIQIRELMHLSLMDIQAKMASQESKNASERSLNNGLAVIGSVLETAERFIAVVWAAYVKGSSIATVKYPKDWSMKTQADLDKELDALEAKLYTVPSKKYRKAILKRITEIMLAKHFGQDTLQEIYAEIDAAKYDTSDPETVNTDFLNGLITRELACVARGYESGEAKKAYAEYVQRLADIQEYQRPGVSGVTDKGSGSGQDSNMSVNQKQDSTGNADPTPSVRGAGKPKGTK